MARLVFWPELNVKPFTQYVAWPCHMWLGLVLIRQHRVLRVWCCWLAFHSSLHGIQSERSQHDCCLFIRRAENGRVRAARSEAQTLEHSGTLYCCRGSRSTPGSHWHRRIKAQRNRHRSAYLYCHVNFSKRKRFFSFLEENNNTFCKISIQKYHFMDPVYQHCTDFSLITDLNSIQWLHIQEEANSTNSGFWLRSLQFLPLGVSLSLNSR